MSRSRGGGGVPRGPPAWGELLYEEEWAKRRRWHDRWGFTIFFILGAAIIGLGSIVALGATGPFAFLVIFGSLSVGFLSVAVANLLLEARVMPLRVYERGFTLERVPVARGIRRREVFVPTERIERLELETHGSSEHVFHSLTMTYTREDGRPGTLTKFVKYEEDLTQALIRMLPADSREELSRYLDEQEARRSKAPFPEDTVLYRRGGGLAVPLLIVSMAVLAPGLIMVLLGNVMFTSALGMVMGLMSSVIFAVMSLYLAQVWAVNTVERAFYHEAVPSGGVLVYDVPAWARYFARARDSLPLVEVVSVRRVTDPRRTGSQGELLTTSGGTIKVSGRLVDRLEALGQFESEGNTLHNRWAGKVTGGPLVRASRARLFAMILADVVFCMLLAYASHRLSFLGFGSESFMAVLSVCMVVLVGLVFVLILLADKVGKRERHLAEGMVATEEGIRIPNAPERLRWIPRIKVASIRTGTSFYTNYTEVRTPEGAVRMSFEAAERLRAGGYEVLDSTGRPMQADAFGSWEAHFAVDLGKGGRDGTRGASGGSRDAG